MNTDRLARALSCRIVALFDLVAPQPSIDANVFDRDAEPLVQQRRLDSLDLVEVAVMMDAEFGLRLHQDDLIEVGSIHGLAALVEGRANRGAISDFLARWEPQHGR